ncbi:MAG: serine/threonine-protein kinase [Cyanobacteriota bacterium]|nr:serine/threonine-protein kinase [Cyanobacteriota bacterium]
MNETILAGRYVIVRSLGKGGFGETYLSQDRHLPDHPLCVVKRLKPQQANNPVNLRLFNQEAEILYRLGSHPQIPKLQAHFEQEGEYFLVQDYIEGHNLSQELGAEKPWSETAVIQFLQEILQILVFVHQQQIIHRDIKPANIMRRRQDNQLMLIDFGSVKQITSQFGETAGERGMTVGIHSLGYSPLEQMEGRPQLSSDIYSVGMVALHALTGINPSQLPRRAGDFEILWREHIRVSAGFAAILDRMAQSHYSRRYASAVEALQALEKLVGEGEKKQPFGRFRLPFALRSPPTAPPITAKVESGKVTTTQTNSPKPNASQTSPTGQGSPGSVGKKSTTSSQLTFALQHTFLAHPGGVRALVISWDEQLLISGGADRLVKVWHLTSGELQHTFSGHQGIVFSLAFNGIQHQVISSSDDKSIRIWDLTGGGCAQTISSRTDWATAMSVSPDGRTLITGNSDGSLKLQSLPEGQLLYTLKGHAALINSLSLTQDGETLVSGSSDNSLRVWSLSKGQVLKTLQGHSDWVNAVVIDPQGQMVVSGSSDHTLKIWDPQQGKVRHTLKSHTQRVTCLAKPTLGSGLVSGSADRTLKVWNLDKAKEVATLRGHAGMVTAAAISMDGKILVSGGWDGQIKIWQSP